VKTKRLSIGLKCSETTGEEEMWVD